MKYKLPLLGLMILLLSLSSPPATDHATATVEQKEGIYVFMFSKPAAAYDYLGTIEKKGMVASGKPDEMLRIMLKKAKQDHPTCQAIIFTETNMFKADCIKFKE